jgi:hypothetical protein
MASYVKNVGVAIVDSVSAGDKPKAVALPTATELLTTTRDGVRRSIVEVLRSRAEEGKRQAVFGSTNIELLQEEIIAAGYKLRKLTERTQIGSSTWPAGHYVVEW